MNIRTRKFIGVILCFVTLVVYSLVAMVVGSYFVGAGSIIELIVFILLGLGWLPLVMLIIAWASRPSPSISHKAKVPNGNDSSD